MTTVLDADATTFDEKINATTGIVLVDFTAEWCGPCKMIAPVLEQLAAEAEDLTVLKVDADASWELTGLYEVMSFPTLIFFVDGRAVHRLVGARGLGSLREELHRVREAVAATES
jgi:thioredoxin 1